MVTRILLLLMMITETYLEETAVANAVAALTILWYLTIFFVGGVST